MKFRDKPSSDKKKTKKSGNLSRKESLYSLTKCKTVPDKLKQTKVSKREGSGSSKSLLHKSKSQNRRHMTKSQTHLTQSKSAAKRSIDPAGSSIDLHKGKERYHKIQERAKKLDKKDSDQNLKGTGADANKLPTPAKENGIKPKKDSKTRPKNKRAKSTSKSNTTNTPGEKSSASGTKNEVNLRKPADGKEERKRTGSSKTPEEIARKVDDLIAKCDVEKKLEKTLSADENRTIADIIAGKKRADENKELVDKALDLIIGLIRPDHPDQSEQEKKKRVKVRNRVNQAIFVDKLAVPKIWKKDYAPVSSSPAKKSSSSKEAKKMSDYETMMANLKRNSSEERDDENAKKSRWYWRLWKYFISFLTFISGFFMFSAGSSKKKSSRWRSEVKYAKMLSDDEDDDVKGSSINEEIDFSDWVDHRTPEEAAKDAEAAEKSNKKCDAQNSEGATEMSRETELKLKLSNDGGVEINQGPLADADDKKLSELVEERTLEKSEDDPVRPLSKPIILIFAQERPGDVPLMERVQYIEQPAADFFRSNFPRACPADEKRLADIGPK